MLFYKKNKAQKISANFNLNAGFAASLPLLPILKRASKLDFTGVIKGISPNINASLGVSGGGEGEYSGCDDKGVVQGSIEGTLAVSLSVGESSFEFKEKQLNGGALQREGSFTPLEVGSAGNINLKLKEFNKDFKGEWEALVLIFIKSKIRYGSFDWEFIDLKYPIYQTRDKIVFSVYKGK